MTSATVGGVTTTYAYDGDGAQVRQTVNGIATAYVDDTNSGLPVVLAEGTTKDVWGPMGLAERVDATGGVQTALTDAFGGLTFLPGAQESAQPFGFMGQQADGDGLVYLRGRYYAPALDRFLQRDPAVGDAADPLSLNRATYARNDPTTLTDPSGLMRSKRRWRATTPATTHSAHSTAPS